MSTNGMSPKQVLIVGAGFAGLNAAKRLGNVDGMSVTVIDRENHHLFQPLLYQVAMAALSPADIAVPIRSLLVRLSQHSCAESRRRSASTLANRKVDHGYGRVSYDYLLLACGAQHAYFGHEEWEANAPGLKTPAAGDRDSPSCAGSVRDRGTRNASRRARRRQLTFIVVGGGPTGVELAGAIGEMSRYTLGS